MDVISAMKFRVFFQALAIALVLAAMASTPAAAATMHNFGIAFGGFANVTGSSPGPPPSVTIHGTGVGEDTPLVFASASFDQTIVFTNPNQITGGRLVFTADDGSTMTGVYHGISSPPDANGFSDGSGDFRITGGTGRFVGAHGTGRWTLMAQLFPAGSNPSASVLTTWRGIVTY
jgi:hypothetical protein